MGAEEQTISYSAERIIGHGSFGVVFQVRMGSSGGFPHHDSFKLQREKLP